MSIIQKQRNNPLLIGILAFVVGLFIGLVVLGWWLWPVTWVDGDPSSLSAAYQEDYLRAAIEAFGYNGNAAEAQARYTALGPNAPTVLATITANPAGLPPELIASFTQTVGSVPLPPAEEAGGVSTTATLLGVLLCGLVLVLIAALFYFFFLRKKQPSGPPTAAQMAAEDSRQAPRTDYTAAGVEPPISQYMASYRMGDDLFDDSFSVDSPAGEFLGECGVAISETIGVGEPKKVTAFEVWLFDKNDTQTVTKVLMSSNAYNDPAIRQRLEAKGEPVLLSPGGEAVLETQTLQMIARVIEMNYGQSALPAESFLDNFIIELAIWQK
jgi:hypothetical protein